MSYFSERMQTISKMTHNEVKAEIARIEEVMRNDTFPDDDKGGDLALYNLHVRAHQRLQELSTTQDAELERVVAYIRRHWRSGNGALIELLEKKVHRTQC